MKELSRKTESSKSEVGAMMASPFGGKHTERSLATNFGMEAGICRIAIQGYEGSFHQVAAQIVFGKDVEVITCNTFKEVVKIAGNKKESDGGVMAIENSIAGSILPNYNLLQKSNLKIMGELYLQIRQNLLVNPGSNAGRYP